MLYRIFHSIAQYLHKPMHFYSRPWILIGLNIILSTLIMIFYEPFGYRFDSWAEFTQLVGFCIIAFFTSVLFFLGIPQAPRLRDWMKQWTVGKNLVYSFIFLLFTGICISFYDFHMILQYRAIDYGTRVFYTCLLTDTVGTITIGVVPLCIGLLLEHMHRLKQDLNSYRNIQIGLARELKMANEKREQLSSVEAKSEEAISAEVMSAETESAETESAEVMSAETESAVTTKSAEQKTIDKEVETTESILLTGDTKESLEISPFQILFLEASGNYVNVCFQKDKQTRKMLRTTLKNIEEKLNSYPFLAKCHRTYIVNIRFIQSIERNNQGYFLQLTNCAQEIPVSRTYLKELRERIKP